MNAFLSDEFFHLVGWRHPGDDAANMGDFEGHPERSMREVPRLHPRSVANVYNRLAE
jgi:hypothetical protein